MNALDWILLALLALAAIRGYARGIVQELFSVAAPVAGLAAALFLYKWGAELLSTRFGLTVLPEVVAFAALFLIAFLLVKILAKVLREGLEAAELDKLDKVLGFVLGLAEGLVIIAVVLIIIQVQPIFDASALLADSIFAKTILPIVGPSVSKALESVGSHPDAALKALPKGK